MFIRDILLFLTIQSAMGLFSFAEAYQEGDEGSKHNPHWFSISLPGGYRLHAYHVFIFMGVFPILLFGVPIVLIGWNTHLFLVLLFSYLVGLIVEDFLWFVVNPQYSFKKWNPRDTRWYPWITFGKTFAFPLSYAVTFLLSGLLLFLIIRI